MQLASLLAVVQLVSVLAVVQLVSVLAVLQLVSVLAVVAVGELAGVLVVGGGTIVAEIDSKLVLSVATPGIKVSLISSFSSNSIDELKTCELARAVPGKIASSLAV